MIVAKLSIGMAWKNKSLLTYMGETWNYTGIEEFQKLTWKLLPPSIVCLLWLICRILNSLVNKEQQKLNSIRYGHFFPDNFSGFSEYRFGFFLLRSVWFLFFIFFSSLFVTFWWVISVLCNSKLNWQLCRIFKQLNFLNFRFF